MLHFLIPFLAVSRQMLVNLDGPCHFSAALLYTESMAELLKTTTTKLWCFGCVYSSKLDVCETTLYL